MGIDVEGVIIVGYSLKKEFLMEKKTFINYTTCNCGKKGEDQEDKYCMDCGVKFKSKIVDTIKRSELREYRIKDEYDNGSLWCFIVLREYVTGSHRHDGISFSKININFKDLEKEKNDLRNKIEKFTIWNENDFGIYFGLDVG